MSRGRLKPEDERCIQTNYLYLKENLDALHIVDYLFQHRVINLDDKEKIYKNGLSRSERNELMLSILLTAGPGDNFNYFLKSLEKEYQGVLKYIERTVKEQKSFESIIIENEQLKVTLDQNQKKIKTFENENKLLKETLCQCKSELETKRKEYDDHILICTEEKNELLCQLQIENLENTRLREENENYKIKIETNDEENVRPNTDLVDAETVNGASKEQVEIEKFVCLVDGKRELYGHHETEMLLNGETDVNKCMSACKKCQNSNDFKPVETFNINDLPVGYRGRHIFEFIKSLADLTVRVDVMLTSIDRPEFIPGTKIPYPFSEFRGNSVMRTGSGFVSQVSHHLSRCICLKCQVSKTSSNKFWRIYVTTAKQVVFDESEGKRTHCKLFYHKENYFALLDSPSDFVENNPKGIVSLTYATCDSEIGGRFEQMIRKYYENFTNLNGTQETYDSKIVCVVSHPHGGTKKISFGVIKSTFLVESKIHHATCKILYTAKTCLGSSGAPVYFSGYQKHGCSNFVHSGTLQNDLNYSENVKLDIVKDNSTCLLM